MRTIGFAGLIILNAVPALASPCVKCIKRQVVVQQVVKEVPVVVEQRVAHYFVGAPAGLGYAPLQQAQYGQIERQMQRLADRLAELKEAQAYQQPYAMPYAAPAMQCPGPAAQQAPCPTCQANPEVNGNPPVFSQTQRPSVLGESCARCHTGSGKGTDHFDIGQLQSMTREERMNVLRAAASGEMPKGGQSLTYEQLGRLSEEVLTAPAADSNEQPLPVPPPPNQ
jgi:cytochrome c553